MENKYIDKYLDSREKLAHAHVVLNRANLMLDEVLEKYLEDVENKHGENSGLSALYKKWKKDVEKELNEA